MKIAHVCLSCFYIDGMSYQENELVRSHVADGHEVLVIASTETMDHGGQLIYLEPSRYAGRDGAIVERLPYAGWIPHPIARKLRAYTGARRALEAFVPEAILFHGACAWELRTAARYARSRPEVPFYIDSHEDWNNSARGLVSREVLHRRFYGPVLRSVAGDARKILCVSTETMDFVNETYRVPRSALEFYPLGGNLLADEDYLARRGRKRAELGLGDGETMIVQSGKQTARKKLVEALAAFSAAPNDLARLFVAGSISDEIAGAVHEAIAADARVSFLGWQSREDLLDLLCAADVYLQPGTQSATMQQALCCRCAVILDDVPAHRVYQRDNGWFIGSETTLESAFVDLSNADIKAMSHNSAAIAAELLDYRVLARRILS